MRGLLSEAHDGLEGPRIVSWWGRDFPHLSRLALRPIQPPIHWVTRLSARGKAARVWRLPPTPQLVPRLKKE
jgi:hypothetical protein